jgi:CubicO group peptidase (beta-lactamase class C family)
MQLVGRGQIDLDASVQQYLPEFRSGVSSQNGPVTVRHLLHHTSGIPAFAPRAEGEDQSLEAQIAALNTIELSFTPGSTYEYASPNYIVLGRIVEIVSGLSFAEYIQQSIYDPLEMTNSYTSMEAAQQAEYALGHRLWFGLPLVSALPFDAGRLPTATLLSSVTDLATYMIAQLNGGQWGTISILDPTLVAQMHQPAVAAEDDQFYAMGWRYGPINVQTAIHHGGILPDYRGKIVMLPEANRGVVVLTNVSSVLGRPSSHDIADDIATLIDGQPLSTNQFGLGTFYLVITIGVVLVTLQQVRNLLSIRRWRDQHLDASGRLKSRSKVLLELGAGIAVPLALLVGLPWVLRLSWGSLFEQLPDLSIWILVLGILEIMIALLRVRSLGQGVTLPSSAISR